MRIRFDTRDTKPRLLPLQILTAAAALIVGILAMTAGDRAAAAICAVAAVYALGVILALLRAWREQIRYNPYSYNTIFYFGFALFALSVMITLIGLTARILKSPELYTGNAVLIALLDSAKNYMLISAPFLLVFSAALCVSNLALLRHEGRRLVNVLGIVLSFLLVAGAVFLFRFDYYATGSQMEVMLHDLFANLFAAVSLYVECMLIGVIVADAIAARHEPDKDKDFLIVLGCGLRPDGYSFSDAVLTRGQAAEMLCGAMDVLARR